MIYGIVGKPGGGKSYEAVVYHIIPSLSKGRKVITNLPLNVELLVKTFGEDVRDLIVVIDGKLNDFGSTRRPFSNIEDYNDGWRNKDGQAALYVIDEAHLVLPTRGCNVPILEWYSMHRHLGIDIILITQNFRKLNRDVKDMIELTYSCQKNTAFGSPNSYTQKVRSGAAGETVNTSQRRYKDSYFPFYQSHTSSNKAVQEAYASDVKSIWKTWPFIGSLIMMLLSIAILSTLFFDDEPVVEQVVSVDSSGSGVDVTSDNSSPNSSSDGFNQTYEVVAGSEFVGDFGPLIQYDFYVTGHMIQSKFDRNGNTVTYLSDGSFDVVFISVYLNDKFMFKTDSNNLKDLGYVFSSLSECVYALDYEGYRRVITCAPEIKKSDKSALETMNPFAMKS